MMMIEEFRGKKRFCRKFFIIRFSVSNIVSGSLNFISSLVKKLPSKLKFSFESCCDIIHLESSVDISITCPKLLAFKVLCYEVQKIRLSSNRKRGVGGCFVETQTKNCNKNSGETGFFSLIIS